jgi:K+-sensing histidine kinase KdpD
LSATRSNILAKKKSGSDINRGKKLTVRDWGVGIPRHQHRKVFEKFFRSSNEARYRTDGIGLGYSCQSIVENFRRRSWSKGGGKGLTFASIPATERKSQQKDILGSNLV